MDEKTLGMQEETMTTQHGKDKASPRFDKCTFNSMVRRAMDFSFYKSNQIKNITRDCLVKRKHKIQANMMEEKHSEEFVSSMRIQEDHESQEGQWKVVS